MKRREFLCKAGLGVIALAALPKHFPVPFPTHPPVGPFKLYEVNGITQFPVYGGDGGLTHETISWLTCIKGKNLFSYSFDPHVLTLKEAERNMAKLLAEEV